MAQTYEQWKKSYESLDDAQKKQYADIAQSKWADYIGSKYLSQYNAASTPQTWSSNTWSSYTYKSEYAWQWSKNAPEVKDTSWDKWSWNYVYDDKSWYYQKQETPTTTTGWATWGTPSVTTWGTAWGTTTWETYWDKLRSAWNNMTPEQQQAALQKSPALKDSLKRYGIVVWETPTTTDTWKWEWKPETPQTWDGWDYQDNSPERMAQIADNVNKLAASDPNLFTDEDAFRRFFIDWKGRTPEQEQFLMDLFKNRKLYNDLDNYTSGQIWNMYVNGRVPDSYLNYLKLSNPQRYAEIMDAKAKAEDDIRDTADYDTISFMSGDTDGLSTSKVIEWLKAQWLLVDKDWNLIDDRTENYASEEEKWYQREIADINARNLEIDNIVKHTYEDYVKKYPWATKATLMAMAQDTNSDLLREKENNLVQLTRLQGYVWYMQQEREDRTQIWREAIAQIQKEYWMYYDYSPQWMSEMAQMQYAATNVTLTQADNWTYTQKQMAVDAALTPYYDNYWDILFTSKAEAIDQAINYAQQNWVSLQTALNETFYKDLYNNPYYLQKVVWDTWWYWDWKVIGKDDLWNDVYWFVNTSTWVVVPYWSVWWYWYWGWYSWGTWTTSWWYIDVPRNVNWYKDNIWADTNNFGNITSMVEWAIGMYHSPNGRDYAVFANAEDWYNALLKDLANKQAGNTRTWLNWNSTVWQLIWTWVNGSWTVDPNNKYAQAFVKASWLSLNDKIWNVSTEKLARWIMAWEWTLSAYEKWWVDLSWYAPATPSTTDPTAWKFDKNMADIYDEFADAKDADKTKIAARYWKTRQEMDAEVNEYEWWKNAQDVKPLIDEIDRLLDWEVEIPPRLQRMKTVWEDFWNVAEFFTVGKMSDRNYKWMAIHNHIYNTLWMEKFIDLKNRKATFWALSDPEREAIYAAASAFQPWLDEKEYKNQLRLIRNTLVQSGRWYLDNYHYSWWTMNDAALKLWLVKTANA